MRGAHIVFQGRLGLRDAASLMGQSTVKSLTLSDSFVAIDFETADYGADSACAIGLVKVDGDRIVRKEKFLIRPPSLTKIIES